MDKNVLSFTKVQPAGDLINEIWSFNVKNLQSINDGTISQYVIALGQWLIYYKAQVNETKANINQLQSDLEFLVSSWSQTEEIPKRFKTKTEIREYIINNHAESSIMQKKLNDLKAYLIRVDGVDKAVSELIAAFKRELTRRDNELYTIRRERRS